MNPIKAFFEKRKKQKKRKQYFQETIKQEEFEPFLKEVDKALRELYSEYADSDAFLDKMGSETTRWLNDLPQMNLASFKAGTCYGIFAYCKIRRESMKKESYIA